MKRRFWELPLTALSPAEFEALCDGCGKCCFATVPKLMLRSMTPCPLLDTETNRCTDYPNRLGRGVGCNKITLKFIRLGGLPSTCAYVKRYDGTPLEQWQIDRARANLKG